MNECKPLGLGRGSRHQRPDAGRGLHSLTSELNLREGLQEHIAHVRAQLEYIWDESTGYFGLHGGQSKLKLSGKGQSKLKLSGNWNECKPLDAGRQTIEEHELRLA